MRSSDNSAYNQQYIKHEIMNDKTIMENVSHLFVWKEKKKRKFNFVFHLKLAYEDYWEYLSKHVSFRRLYTQYITFYIL